MYIHVCTCVYHVSCLVPMCLAMWHSLTDLLNPWLPEIHVLCLPTFPNLTTNLVWGVGKVPKRSPPQSSAANLPLPDVATHPPLWVELMERKKRKMY